METVTGITPAPGASSGWLPGWAHGVGTLDAGGFAIFAAEQDTVALKRDTETYRRKIAADAKPA